MLVLSGKDVAEAKKIELQSKVAQFQADFGRAPGLAVVIVGNDPASQIYVKNKAKTCEKLGMEGRLINLSSSDSQDKLMKTIEQLNADPAIDGILVQLPLPKGFDKSLVLKTIAPSKDPDGLTFENLGLLWAGEPRIRSCTPYGIIQILEHYKIDVTGKEAVVVGRSNIVGKPMAQMLMDGGATVTICHSKTRDLLAHTTKADIVVVAAGKPQFLGRDAFKQGATVIDVGIHRTDNGLCGDVRFSELEGHVYAATPVPGGVGPMTIATLMQNTYELAKLREAKSGS